MKSQLTIRRVNENEWTWTILGLAILLGAFVRFYPGLLAKFPINDGGMFAVMIRNLRANHFILPVYTTYNYLNIPFAYPPLGFYLGGLFELLGLPELQMLIWVPVFLTIATVPLYYLLAFELLKNRPRAALASVFFALAPGNYVWYLMGGGLTRALGAVFFILSLYFFHRTLQARDRYTTVLAIIFCSLTVFSHPQYALLTAISCLVFWVFNKPSHLSLLSLFLVGGGTLLLTSPWWGLMIQRHGAEVFLSAAQSGDIKASLTAGFLRLFSRQTILPFATLFWLFGFVWVIYKRRFDLLVWGFLPYVIDQRSAPIISDFLFPILAAYGVLDAIPALLNWVRTRKFIAEADEIVLNQRALSMSLLAIIMYLFFECFFYSNVVVGAILPDDSRQMMVWVKENTPVNGRFLILTGREDVMTDSMQEWFPALASRNSATTLQSLEWVLQEKFNSRLIELAILQNCRDIDCFNKWSQKLQLEYSYIIVDTSRIPVDIFLSTGYLIIFDNGRYAVLQ